MAVAEWRCGRTWTTAGREHGAGQPSHNSPLPPSLECPSPVWSQRKNCVANGDSGTSLDLPTEVVSSRARAGRRTRNTHCRPQHDATAGPGPLGCPSATGPATRTADRAARSSPAGALQTCQDANMAHSRAQGPPPAAQKPIPQVHRQAPRPRSAKLRAPGTSKHKVQIQGDGWKGFREIYAQDPAALGPQEAEEPCSRSPQQRRGPVADIPSNPPGPGPRRHQLPRRPPLHRKGRDRTDRAVACRAGNGRPVPTHGTGQRRDRSVQDKVACRSPTARLEARNGTRRPRSCPSRRPTRHQPGERCPGFFCTSSSPRIRDQAGPRPDWRHGSDRRGRPPHRPHAAAPAKTATATAGATSGPVSRRVPQRSGPRT